MASSKRPDLSYQMLIGSITSNQGTPADYAWTTLKKQMRPERPKISVVVALTLALGVLLAGCADNGSTNPDASYDAPWSSAQAVIDEMNEFRFGCSPDPKIITKQVLTEHPVTKEPFDGALVICEGYQVLLLDNPDKYYDELRAECANVTEESLASESLSREAVIGSNYIISGVGPNQGYPENAQSKNLAKAFSGEVKSLKVFYEELCDGIPAKKGGES